VRRLILLLVVGLVLAGCADSSSKAGAGTEITVSVSRCGAGWQHATPGPQHFVLHDADTRAGEVDLIDPSSGAVYAEVEPMGPDTETTLDADLGSGHYAFRCFMEDEPAVTGPTITLAGHVMGDTPAVLPVSQGDLIDATKAYQQYVIGRLPGLLAAARTLSVDVARGDLAAARRDWLPAHLDYLRLGAAYDAFGDLDADIDARADGRPEGVADPSWRGLHRIEYGLWHGQAATTLAPLAADLIAAVRGLQRDFPRAQIDPLDISIRAHEITEDAVEFALTGRDDYGSHSGLATVRADVDGTRTVLGMIRPLLTPRYHAIARLDTQLDRVQSDVDATRTGSTYPPLSALDQATRERVDADVSELAELLAPIAAVLEPRRTS
jgi:iron uptake system component EfeO